MKSALLVAMLGASFACTAGCGGSAVGDGHPAAVDDTVGRVQLASSVLGGIPSCSSQFGPPGPGPVTMTYDRATREATWKSCDTALRVEKNAKRVLTEAEGATMEAALVKITYVENPECAGMDGNITTMTTYSAKGQQLYVDRNINCYTDGRRGAPLLIDAFTTLDTMHR
jgi:hypothetical protein